MNFFPTGVGSAERDLLGRGGHGNNVGETDRQEEEGKADGKKNYQQLVSLVLIEKFMRCEVFQVVNIWVIWTNLYFTNMFQLNF